MKKMRMLITAVLLVATSVVMFAQTREVSGKVTSSVDGTPVAEVTVRLKGAIGVTKTDAEGTFKILMEQNSSEMLVFTHPNFDDIEIAMNGKSKLNLVMTSNVRLNQYGQKVSRKSLNAEERNGILVLESKDQKYKVWYDIRIQVDGATFFNDDYNKIGNGTSIRRARFAVKSQIAENWYGEIDMDISNSELELKDAYLKYFTDNLEIKAGNFKEGFSLESTTTSRYLTFIERPMSVSAFAPSRHIGIAATYSNKWFFTVGGVHFQDIGGLEERVFSKDHNKDFGVSEGYSYTGKIVLMPWYNDADKGMHFGLAASYRKPTTDAEIAGSIRYDVRSLTSINRKKYIDTDNIPFVDNTVLTGIEYAGYYKNMRLQAEYMTSTIKRRNNLATENFEGGYVFGSYLLFGGKYNYNAGEAEFTQPTRGKEWGDIELSLRYDYLSLNSHMDRIMGGSGEGITFGVNYHVNNNVKIMLNYSDLNHDRYASGKNKLFVGYDLDGNLTKNPKLVADSMGKAGNDFGILALRFEIDF